VQPQLPCVDDSSCELAQLVAFSKQLKIRYQYDKEEGFTIGLG
jgi:hypothetical protein